MEKKYNYEPDENNNMLNEPAMEYGIASSKTDDQHLPDEQIEELIQAYSERPCQFTPEQLRERIRQGMKEIENGKYISHEEMKKRFIS